MASNRQLSEFHDESFENMVDLINKLREKNEELLEENKELSEKVKELEGDEE